MNTIRSAVLWLLMFLTIAIMGPFHILAAIFVDRSGGVSYRIATAYLHICLFYIGMKLRVEGREHVPADGSFIVMPNHRSWWDIPAVQCAIFPRQLRFIYKRQLQNIPILGWCIRAGGHIGIDREDRESAVRVLRGVARRFSGRFSLVVFPEGTRSPDTKLLRFKRGGFHLSRELELPVIPVSISGTEVIQNRHTMQFHPGTVTIRFHPPMKAEDFASLDAMIERVKGIVEAGLQ